MKSLIQSIRHRYHIKDYRFSLVLLVVATTLIGVFMVGSAKHSLQGSQIFGMVLGLFVMAVLSLIDYKWVLNLYWILYIINIVFLVAVLLFGQTVNGATRWLDLGFVQFQPSDLTKILMILFYAKFLMKHEQSIHNIFRILEAVLLMIPSLILIFKQPNLSNTICLAALFCVMMYMGGLSYKVIGIVLAVFIPVVAVMFLITIQPNQNLLHGYQQTRILAWIHPDEYASDEAYQQLQSVQAIGSGQLSGKGYNSTTATSVKNGNFISEPQTDFIFAIIGEELGFVGCCVVIILLLLIVVDCIMIGMRAKDTGGRIICAGVAALVGIQSFINISVATMLFPNTGISLPFVSYGLTSLVCFYMGIGLVLNVGLQSKKYQ